MDCRQVSNRLISGRLGGAPFNISMIHVYVPTSGHNDEVNGSFHQVQEIIYRPNSQGHSGCTRAIDQTHKYIRVVQGRWNTKVGMDAHSVWEDVCGPYFYVKTN